MRQAESAPRRLVGRLIAGPSRGNLDVFLRPAIGLIAVDMVIAVVCAFSFGHAGNTVCRVQGRLRGRDMPAAG